ncbi:MAG: hypothetical protein JWS10_3580 [Cypionkella sp.]|uniref:rhamnan synthesis F family protein n=1 Tax=Cypionkella sp. TaxID=2811411 RepID=UPI00260FB80B|nr:rhamnan synthesis F family protein [Cypionkella sp.]MDB5660965.1 hypothetical protein [Cypionkella sp.]
MAINRGRVPPGNPGIVKKAALKLFQNVFPRQFSDLYLSRFHKISQGSVPASKKVAIYLIFPKTGILPTHLHSLRYMIENGYAPLVVANLPLLPEDLLVLQPYAWQVLERPNFGYDFGGYRAAILQIEKMLPTLDRLVLLNDSAWFPLAGKMNWLAEAEALGKDFVGAMESGFIKNRGKVESSETRKWAADRTRKNFHYGSYALSIGPKLLGDTGFLKWWKKLRISQGRHRTIRRGETGFSQWVLRNGFSHGSTTEMADLGEVFAAMDLPALRHVFENLNFFDAPKRSHEHEILTTCPGVENLTRQQLEQFMFFAIGQGGAAMTAPRFLIEQKNHTFLKKKIFRPNVRETAALIALINDLGDPMGPDMLAERGLTSAVSQTADKAV